MHKFELWGYKLEIDEKATAAWYKAAAPWGCGCGPCRNFLALAQQRALPTPVLQILDMLNLPPEKATYVCTLYSFGGGYCYQFSYRIAGNILVENPSPEEQPWGVGRCGHEAYPYGAPGFPQPHFDLEFSINLPWILEAGRGE